MAKEISHKIIFNATPAAVFAALMDEREHSTFTGKPAKISQLPGGKFACYGSYITGFNVEIQSPKLIVQAWRARDWPRGTYSIVAFRLTGLPGGKTQLAFTQAGVPASDYRDKNQGWRTHYWEPLKRYIEASSARG